MEQVLATLCKATDVQAAAIVGPDSCITSPLPAPFDAELFKWAAESLKTLADPIAVLNRGQEVTLLTINMDNGSLWIRRVGELALVVLTALNAKVAIISVAMNTACVQIRRVIGNGIDPTMSMQNPYTSASNPYIAVASTSYTATASASYTAAASSSIASSRTDAHPTGSIFSAMQLPTNTIKETAAAASSLLNNGTQSVHEPHRNTMTTLDQIAARTGTFPIQPVLDALHKTGNSDKHLLDQIAARTGSLSVQSVHDAVIAAANASTSEADNARAAEKASISIPEPRGIDAVAAKIDPYQSISLAPKAVKFETLAPKAEPATNVELSSSTSMGIESISSISIQSIESIQSIYDLQPEASSEKPQISLTPAPAVSRPTPGSLSAIPPLPQAANHSLSGALPKLPKRKAPTLPPASAHADASDSAGANSKSGSFLLSSGVRPLKSPTPLRPLRAGSTPPPLNGFTRNETTASGLRRPAALQPQEPPLGLDFVRQLISLANQHIGDEALALIKDAFSHHRTSPQSVKASELNSILDEIDKGLSDESRSKFRSAVQELLTHSGGGSPA